MPVITNRLWLYLENGYILRRRELGSMLVGVRDVDLIAVTGVNRPWGSA